MNTRANPGAAWATTYALLGRDAARSAEEGKSVPGKLIEGFENPQAQEDLLKRWTVSKDSTSEGGALAELSLVSPGANGTQHALRFHGRLGTPTAEPGFVSARLNLPAPTAESVAGIELWIRSDDSRPYQISLVRAGAPPNSNPEIRLTPSADWQPVRLPAPWRSGPPSNPPAAAPLQLEILTTGAAGEFSITLDEVRYY